MERNKAWYKSKTMRFGVLQLLALVVAKIFGVDLTDVVAEMNEEIAVAIVAVESIVILVLRAVTKTKIGPEPPWKPSGGVNMLLVLCIAGIVGLALLGVCGCGGVNMSPEYSALLDRTGVWARVVADKAASGEMSEPQKTEALEVNADLWERFKNARDGVAQEGGDR